MFGAAAMSLSSFCVVSNALRLNLFQPATALPKIRAIRPVELPPAPAPAPAACPIVNQTEVTAMKKTIKIEGMMCGHCEATVKKALEALPQVDAAQVSHTAGTAGRHPERRCGRRRPDPGRGSQRLQGDRHRVRPDFP